MVPLEVVAKVLRLHITVKSVVLVALPLAELTDMVPLVAPDGTVVVIVVAVEFVTTDWVPLNFTVLLAGVVLKFAPVMVTVAPVDPDAGEKLKWKVLAQGYPFDMTRSLAKVTK